ncbi:hypothetical protein CYMTET_26380 [Cymbomonas tetramitiformis]|uniref:Uncharacterized protein n=1 Tax=Cymbomonas tetramitiformis TaxID=36881 RepID=A0AAE0FSD5_9CHLO|nr:hypothetical protein CYMTET_26379 [Cymbomonas tetramitiformis]KAK3264912.1 hypothetical protein CYMTET_26380 [Cymbomonas tetramitiformis]
MPLRPHVFIAVASVPTALSRSCPAWVPLSTAMFCGCTLQVEAVLAMLDTLDDYMLSDFIRVVAYTDFGTPSPFTIRCPFRLRHYPSPLCLWISPFNTLAAPSCTSPPLRAPAFHLSIGPDKLLPLLSPPAFQAAAFRTFLKEQRCHKLRQVAATVCFAESIPVVAGAFTDRASGNEIENHHSRPATAGGIFHRPALREHLWNLGAGFATRVGEGL